MEYIYEHHILTYDQILNFIKKLIFDIMLNIFILTIYLEIKFNYQLLMVIFVI